MTTWVAGQRSPIRPSPRASRRDGAGVGRFRLDDNAVAQWGQRERTLELLHEVAVAAGGVLELSILGKLVVDSARDLLAAHSAGLYWYDESINGLRRIGENDPAHAPIDVVPPHRTSVARFAFDEDRPIVADDYADWSGADDSALKRGLKSAVAVPLRLDQRAVGTLVVRSYIPRNFDQVQVHVLELLAAQVTPVLEGARLHAESERRRIVAESLADLARHGATASNLEGLAPLISERACRLLNGDFAALLVQSDEDLVWRGLHGTRSEAWHSSSSSTVLATAISSLQTQMVIRFDQPEKRASDIRELVDVLTSEDGKVLLVVPLRGAGGTMGILVIGWRVEPNIDQEGQSLADAIANYASVILENLRAHAALAERANRLAVSQRKLQTLYESVACGILVWNQDSTIIRANVAAQEMLGRRQHELLGRKAGNIWTATTEDGQELPLADRSASASNWTTKERRKVNLRVDLPDGELRWLEADVVPVQEVGTSATEIVASFIDVTARRRAEEEMHWQAGHDALTGLPNRTVINNRLHDAIESGKKRNRSVTLMFIDLDRFKDVNDTFGHAYGDALLAQIGPRLENVLRGTDTVGRLGGDEFAIIMPGLFAQDAVKMAQRFWSALTKPLVIGGRTIEIGASVGIASFPHHGRDAQELMRAADVAMYTAKRGNQRFAIYDADSDSNLSGGVSLATELRDAIRARQIRVYYQPKVQCIPGSMPRVEALVRWLHPERGLLTPDMFVPLAEQSGLIGPLTRCVLESVADQCYEWHQSGVDVAVAVNVSIHNLQDPEFSADLHKIISTRKMFPKWLRLEITETTIMTDAPESAIAHLTEMGIPLSIDDFGTGYSSLVRVKKLPIDEIKIDKSFIVNVTSDASDQVIVKSIIDLAHSLEKQVVAEGVETEEAWQWLVSAGCDAAQGYLIARPMPADDFGKWLEMFRAGVLPWARAASS